MAEPGTSRGVNAASPSQLLVTRFAPSPNGLLHLGHGYAALQAHDAAREAGGRFLLRIEDIDGPRSRADYAESAMADLQWLGLAWDGPPVRQSLRLASYAAAAERLKAMGVLYPCRCTRADIAASAVAAGPDGLIYPGTCRDADPSIVMRGPHAWRLDVAKAMQITGPLTWHDQLAGVQQARPDRLGDVVLVRKDAPASYHLAATLDDAADGVNLVVRGADLFAASPIHRLIQALLDLPVPTWRHHRLIIDESGRKLAKSRASAALAERRLSGEDGLALAKRLRAGSLPEGLAFSDR